MTPRLYRLIEVLGRCGMGRTLLYQMVREGRFPPPIPLVPGSRNIAFVADEVDQWLLNHIRTARGEAAASERS